MKTLTKNSVSVYVFEDNEHINMTDKNIAVGNPLKFIIGDCNNGDTLLHENVTPPEDWSGNKYLFDGSAWTPNPDWVDPATRVVAD